MSETKDQTIARLEGELKEANSEVERYRGNYRASQQELAASREIGPCGRHPNACYRVVDPKHLPGQVECTTCAELAASRADALERAAEISDCPQDMANQTATRICTRIRALITPTDAAARDERDKAKHYEGACWMLDSIRASLRVYPNGGGDIEVMKEVDRIRLEEAEWWAECGCIEGQSEKRLAHLRRQLRAPVPAERAGDAVCQTCKGTRVSAGHYLSPLTGESVENDCPDCHGTGRASK